MASLERYFGQDEGAGRLVAKVAGAKTVESIDVDPVHGKLDHPRVERV